MDITELKKLEIYLDGLYGQVITNNIMTLKITDTVYAVCYTDLINDELMYNCLKWLADKNLPFYMVYKMKMHCYLVDFLDTNILTEFFLRYETDNFEQIFYRIDYNTKINLVIQGNVKI